MKITHVKIRDILGIEELEFKAGAFVQIEGENGQGKTSILEGIKSVFKGGEDATLLRNGATKGEVVLVLDNGATISKRVTEKGAYVSMIDADGKVDKRQTAISALADAFSVNPVAFLSAKPEKRVDVLLESLPMEIDEARVREIMGDQTFKFPPGRALAQIDAAYDEVYADRRETSRAIKEKEASINQLQATLPRESTGGVMDPGDGEESLQTRLDNLDAAKEAELERISAKLTGMREEHGRSIVAIREQIAELQAEITRQTEAFAESERRAGVQRERTITRWTADRAPVLETLNTIRQNREMMSRAAATHDTIKRFEGDLATLNSDKSRMEKALEDLKAYKGELLAAIPITGLEIRDGVIYRDGVVFDRLNTAQQVEIAVEVAKLRAKDLGIICVDGMELLDTKHYEAFCEQAVQSGLQLIVTRVSDDALNIKTEA